MPPGDSIHCGRSSRSRPSSTEIATLLAVPLLAELLVEELRAHLGGIHVGMHGPVAGDVDPYRQRPRRQRHVYVRHPRPRVEHEAIGEGDAVHARRHRVPRHAGAAEPRLGRDERDGEVAPIVVGHPATRRRINVRYGGSISITCSSTRPRDVATATTASRCRTPQEGFLRRSSASSASSAGLGRSS